MEMVGATADTGQAADDAEAGVRGEYGGDLGCFHLSAVSTRDDGLYVDAVAGGVGQREDEVDDACAKPGVRPVDQDDPPSGE